MAKIIGEASIRLRADSRGLAVEIRRIVSAALKEAVTGLRAPDGVTKSIGDDAERTGNRVQNTFQKILTSARDMAAGVISAAASGARFAVIGFAALGALSSVVSLTGGIVGLAGAASQAAGVIGLLPAALVAVKAVSATLKLAVDGVGESLKALASGDMQAFQESLKKLSPQARAFVTEIAKVKPEFDKIKRALQETTFEGLSKSIQPLAQRYLPLVNQFFQAIGQSANQAARSVIDFANNGTTARQVQQVLENIATAFNQLIPAIKPALSAFLDLVRVGSSFLPGIAQSITGITERFAAFIRTAAESGALKNFFQTAIDTINQLGRIIADVAVGIRNIFRIGSQETGGFLDNLERMTQKFRDFTESIGGQIVLRDLFGIIRTLAGAFNDVLSALSPLLTPLRQVIGLLAEGLADALREIAPKLAEFGGKLLEQLKDILPDLIPFVAKLAGGILDILTAVTPLLKPLAKLLEALTPLIDPLVRLAEAIIPPLTKVIEILTPHIGKMAEALGKIIDFVARVLEGLDKFLGKLGDAGPVVTGFIDGLVDGINIGLTGGLSALPDIGNLFGKQVVQGIAVGAADETPGLLLQIQNIIEQMTGGFQTGLPASRAAGGAISRALADGLTAEQQAAVDAAMNAIRGMLGIFDGVGKAGARASGSGTAKAYQEGFSAQQQAILDQARAAINGMLAIFNGGQGAAESEGARIARGLGSGVSSEKATVEAAARGVVAGIQGAVSGGSLFSQGAAIIKSLANGMLSQVQAVVNAARSFLGIITQNKGPESVDRVLLYPAGQLIIQGLVNGMNAKRALVAKTMQGFTDQISSMTTEALNPGPVTIRGLAPVNADRAAAARGADGAFTLNQYNTMLPGADVTQFANEVWKNGAAVLASGNAVLGVSPQPVQAGMSAPGSVVTLGA